MGGAGTMGFAEEGVEEIVEMGGEVGVLLVGADYVRRSCMRVRVTGSIRR